MKKIKVRVNIGPVYDSVNIAEDFNYNIEPNATSNPLFKAIEASIKKLNLESNKFLIGFIDIFEGKKKIYHSSLLKCGDKLSYNKNI